MSVRKRIKKGYRAAKVPPDGIKRASRYERIRRNVWMISSTVVAFTVCLVFLSVAMGLLTWLGMPKPEGLPGAIAILSIWLVASAIIDLKIFAWGIDYFSIVAPWQFRVDMEDSQ